MDVRQSFLRQSAACADLGSPFTALLCRTIGENLIADCAVADTLLGWSGDAAADALALRLCGALHMLVRSGKAAALAPLYPPADPPSAECLRQAVRSTFVDHESDILGVLASPPQTNEVARSAVLLGGFLTIAAETRRPLDLIEIGASAGLNLNWDRYGYRLGATVWGDQGSLVQISADWRSTSLPPHIRPEIQRRAGCDRNPLDPASPHDRERLLSYVWPDQPARLVRLEAALNLAANLGTRVERMDAAAFVARELMRPAEGATRVIYHSIVWQYLPQAIREAIAQTIEEAGAIASPRTPVAWLAFEPDGRGDGAALTLRLWPNGETKVLARADFHGRWVAWA